jgi:hypothetical protein
MSVATIKTVVVWSTAELSASEHRLIRASLAQGRTVQIPGVRVFVCDSDAEAQALKETLETPTHNRRAGDKKP